MKIAATVILYHPCINAINNILSYADSVDRVFVFDNTEGFDNHINQTSFNNNKIHYFHDGLNQGIAHRLNQATSLAIYEGYEWLLMMDQDSSFKKETFNLYVNNVLNYPEKENVALFGTNFSRKPQISLPTIDAQEVISMITSGNLLNLSLYPIIGPFDEALFIDAVDTEYCLRASKAGYKIVKLLNIFLQHELGESVTRASIKTLFLIKKTKEIHSPLRCYYIYRNNLYLQTKYKYFDKTAMKDINQCVMTDIKKSLLYGQEFKAIIKYILSARKDFRQNKMGKYQE